MLGKDLVQDTLALVSHLIDRREALRRVRIGCTHQKPVEGLVAFEQRHLVAGGQRLGIAVTCQVDGQLGQRAAHRVHVGGYRRACSDDLGRLKTLGAIDVSEVADTRYRTHVDQLDVVLGQHDVLGLEIVVDQAERVQVGQRRQHVQHIAERLLDGHHPLVVTTGRPLLRQDGFQRGAADVLHHDVADGAPVEPGAFDEVVDLDDAGVVDHRKELPFGDSDGLRLLAPGLKQAFEHNPPVAHIAVDRQIDPADPAVGDAALDVVLTGDELPRLQLW